MAAPSRGSHTGIAAYRSEGSGGSSTSRAGRRPASCAPGQERGKLVTLGSADGWISRAVVGRLVLVLERSSRWNPYDGFDRRDALRRPFGKEGPCLSDR